MRKIKQYSFQSRYQLFRKMSKYENSTASDGLDMIVTLDRDILKIATICTRTCAGVSRNFRIRASAGLKHFRFHTGNTVDSPVANQASQLDRARPALTSKVRIHPRYVSLLFISTQFTKICAEFRAARKRKSKLIGRMGGTRPKRQKDQEKKWKKGENRFVQLKTGLLYAKSKQKDIDKKRRIVESNKEYRSKAKKPRWGAIYINIYMYKNVLKYI